jgi:hypothetical protein
VESSASNTPPRWYWIAATLAFLWMGMGVMAWLVDLRMDDAAMAELTAGQRTLYETRPQWVFVVYGIATFGGLAGALGLLLRKAWATPLLAISLVAVIVQFGYTFLGLDAIGLLGAGEALPFPITIIAVCAAVLWFSMRAKARGWLGS